MADILFNGAPVSRVTISMPRHGAWTANVDVASATVVTGRCVIDVGGMLFNGKVRRGGEFQGDTSYWVVGGADTIRDALPSRFYLNVPVSIPVRDILTEAGQPIAETSDNLSTFLPQWLRMAGRAASSLEALLDEVGALWRILDDGTAWYGVDSWPEVSVNALVLDRDRSGGTAEVATDTPIFRPGTTWQGEQISYVIHRLTPSSSRTELWFE
jgi:hypothetical protein